MKSSVTRRQTAEPVDQAERQLQAEHHQAAESAAQAANKAATAMQATEAVPSIGSIRRRYKARSWAEI